MNFKFKLILVFCFLLIYSSNSFSQPMKLGSKESIFIEHVIRGSFDDVKVALDKYPEFAKITQQTTPNDDWESGLILASLMGHEKIVEILLKNGALINHKTKNGRTAMHGAMVKGSPQLLKMLVEAGADIYSKDTEDNTPLSQGIFSGNIDAVIYIASIMKDFGRKVDECYCLFQAIGDNNLKMLDLLLKNGANVNISRLSGETPLIYAASDRENLLGLLLSAGANKDIKDITGKTALDSARNYKNQKAISILERR